MSTFSSPNCDPGPVLAVLFLSQLPAIAPTQAPGDGRCPCHPYGRPRWHAWTSPDNGNHLGQWTHRYKTNQSIVLRLCVCHSAFQRNKYICKTKFLPWLLLCSVPSLPLPSGTFLLGLSGCPSPPLYTGSSCAGSSSTLTCMILHPDRIHCHKSTAASDSSNSDRNFRKIRQQYF